MKKSIGFVALATAVTLGVTGCTAGGVPADDAHTLYVLTSDTAFPLDPANNVTLPTDLIGLVARRLTTWEIGDDGRALLVPDLATDLGTPSEDGAVWTYTLKDDIFFEDGTPITSADIKYGLERTFSPELAGGLAYHQGLLVDGPDYSGPFDGAELDSIETPDDRTIVFHLITGYGDWPWLTALNPFAPVPVGDGVDVREYDVQPVSSGPYRVESNEWGVEAVLVRNEHWDAATDEVRTAEPDRIVIRQGQNPTTTTQSLISDTGDAKNSIGALPLSAAELALVRAEEEADRRRVTSEGGLSYYLALNTERDGLADPRVRQAVQHAVDRSVLIRARGGDESATALTTLIGPDIPGYTELDRYPEDVEVAQDLLTDAGYPDGITLELWVANGDAAIAEALQEGLARAGITLLITPLDFGQMYGDAMFGDPDYDMFLSVWIPDYPSANTTLGMFFDSTYIDGGFNLSRYDDPDVDAAIAAAITTSDPAESAAAWAAVEQLAMAGAPVVPLFVARHSFLAGSNVSDIVVPGYPAYPNYLKIGLSAP